MDYQLKQAGRASIDFLVDLRKRFMAAEAQIDEYATREGVKTDRPASQLGIEGPRIAAVLEQNAAFEPLKALHGWQIKEHGKIAQKAFDEIGDDVIPKLRELEHGPTRLQRNAELQVPAYWDGIEFHGTTGGWDGHDFQGFVHAELVFHHVLKRTRKGSLAKERLAAAQAASKPAYDRILEFGCSSGIYTQALEETFPSAEIWACDLSMRQLEQAQRRANENDWSWTLFHAAAENTGLDDNSFDLVTSYAVFHEIPAADAETVLAECRRLLKPGGEILMADVQPYSIMTAYEAWKSDLWNDKLGDDPYWTDYATRDFEEMARRAGFVDAKWRGLGEMQYPFVLTARKPEIS